MDNPGIIALLGTIAVAVVTAFFGLWAFNVQKAQSDADQGKLLAANKTLSDSVSQKNEELAKKSDELYRILNEQQKETKLYADEQKNSGDEIRKLQNELLEKSEIQQSLQENQIKKSEEIAGLYKELYNYQTGGDSFCYLDFAPIASENKVYLHLNHKGKYPIRDLQICINTQSYQLGNSDDVISFNRQIVGSNTRVSLGAIPFPGDQDTIFWSIGFQTADGTKRWFQRVFFIIDKNLRELPNYKDIALRHRFEWQTYRLDEKITPTYFKLYGQTQERKGADLVNYTQVILKETKGLAEKSLNWNNHPHVGCNTYIRGSVDKIEYATELK